MLTGSKAGQHDQPQVWDTHYTRERSRQSYPDENVVRFVKKFHTPAADAAGVSLDLGSGSGRHLPLLAEHFSRVVACDFSRESLRPYSGKESASVQAALPELPFADQTFHFILCWGVLHYLPDALIAPAAMEIQRCLRPGGRVFLTLRSDSDTHLAGQLAKGDLAQGHARLFSKTEALAFFSGFAHTEYGFILRQPLGESTVVAHHMIAATRSGALTPSMPAPDPRPPASR